VLFRHDRFQPEDVVAFNRIKARKNYSVGGQYELRTKKSGACKGPADVAESDYFVVR